MQLKRILDVACAILSSSVVLDTVLWFARGYMIPCWTMAAMSLGGILLLQAFKREALR